MINKILNQRYKVVKKIGAGSYGDVYLVNDTLNSNAELALKCSSLH